MGEGNPGGKPKHVNAKHSRLIVPTLSGCRVAPVFVIPAKAGIRDPAFIEEIGYPAERLDSGFRRNDEP
jgi:hypothetical protein